MDRIYIYKNSCKISSNLNSTECYELQNGSQKSFGIKNYFEF